MKFTTTDDNGNAQTIGYTIKRVLSHVKQRGYGWAVKPDTRGKHPSRIKPHIDVVIVLDSAMSAGRAVVARYTTHFGE